MQDKMIAVDGVNIRYRDSGGDGPTVLMTHGIAGSLELWQKQLETADGTVRLMAWDMPGHGLSGMGEQPYDPDSFSRFAWRFADALGLQKLVLVGNSLGGAISLRMADLQPNRVAGLLLSDAATLGRETYLPFRLMTLPLLGEVMNRPGSMAVEQQLKALFHDPSVVTDELRACVTRNVHKPGAVAPFLATLRRMTNLSGQRPLVVERSRAILGALQIPVTIVHGRQDIVLPLSHSQAAAALCRQAEIIVLEDCGHTPQFEQPQRFNQILSDLLKRAASREGIPA